MYPTKGKTVATMIKASSFNRVKKHVTSFIPVKAVAAWVCTEIFQGGWRVGLGMGSFFNSKKIVKKTAPTSSTINPGVDGNKYNFSPI
jgi:hypothetical protein